MWDKNKQRKAQKDQGLQLSKQIAEYFKYFAIMQCSRCDETDFRLLEMSPNGKSIKYECVTCNKTQWAKATAPEAAEATEYYRKLQDLPISVDLQFKMPDLAQQAEANRREPIPESVRNEVWRRDQGQCVKCGSQENLEFDHIIPHSKGGADTARNLQLLCQTCNRSKGASI